MDRLFQDTTMNLLTRIEGFQGAIAVNFRTGQLLDYAEFGDIDLRPAADLCARTIRRHLRLNRDLALNDILERTLTVTDLHYHIVYLLPQFDNVALYFIANRYAKLPNIIHGLEEAAFSMR